MSAIASGHRSSQRPPARKAQNWSEDMAVYAPRFVLLKAINGEPMLVNLAAVRAVTTIDLAGDELGVIAFDENHEVVVGSTVSEVMAAIALPPVPIGE
jgi:hypothetical protein